MTRDFKVKINKYPFVFYAGNITDAIMPPAQGRSYHIVMLSFGDENLRLCIVAQSSSGGKRKSMNWI